MVALILCLGAGCVDVAVEVELAADGSGQYRLDLSVPEAVGSEAHDRIWEALPDLAAVATREVVAGPRGRRTERWTVPFTSLTALQAVLPRGLVTAAPAGLTADGRPRTRITLGDLPHGEMMGLDVFARRLAPRGGTADDPYPVDLTARLLLPEGGDWRLPAGLRRDARAHMTADRDAVQPARVSWVVEGLVAPDAPATRPVIPVERWGGQVLAARITVHPDDAVLAERLGLQVEWVEALRWEYAVPRQELALSIRVHGSMRRGTFTRVYISAADLYLAHHAPVLDRLSSANRVADLLETFVMQIAANLRIVRGRLEGDLDSRLDETLRLCVQEVPVGAMPPQVETLRLHLDVSGVAAVDSASLAFNPRRTYELVWPAGAAPALRELTGEAALAVPARVTYWPERQHLGVDSLSITVRAADPKTHWVARRLDDGSYRLVLWRDPPTRVRYTVTLQPREVTP